MGSIFSCSTFADIDISPAVNCLNFTLNSPNLSPIVENVQSLRDISLFLSVGAEPRSLTFYSCPESSAKEAVPWFESIAETLETKSSYLTSLELNGSISPGLSKLAAAALAGNAGLEKFMVSGTILQVAQPLLDSLRANRTLQSVRFANDYIDQQNRVDNLAPLLRALQSHPSLRQVSYSGTEVKALAELIVSLPDLEDLEIFINNVNISDVQILCSALDQAAKPVKKFHLSTCCLKGAEMAALCQSKRLRSTKKLNISCSGTSPEDAKIFAERLLSGNGAIRRLNFSYDLIGTAGVRYLAAAAPRSLVSLKLERCGLDSDSGKLFAGMLPRLITLDLTYNALRDEGVIDLMSKSLGSRSLLKKLRLASNQITERGGKVLAQWLISASMLTTLDLSKNKLGSDGGRAIAEAVAQNERLRIDLLWLDSNNIKEPAAESFVRMIKRPGAVRQLRISGPELGANGKALVESAALKCGVLLIYHSPGRAC